MNDNNNQYHDSAKPNRKRSTIAFWICSTNHFHRLIKQSMVSLSLKAAKSPRICMSSIVALSLIMLGIGFVTNFKIELDETVVYAPFNSKPVLNQQWYQDPDTGFPKKTREFLMLAHADGQPALNLDVFRTLFRAINVVKKTPGYDDFCSQGEYIDPFDKKLQRKTCEIFSITRFWEYNLTLFDSNIKSNDDLYKFVSDLTYPDGRPVAYELLFGTPDIHMSKALFTMINIPDTGPGSEDFELRALDNLFKLQEQLANENAVGKLEAVMSQSFTNEFLSTIVKDLPLIPCVLGAMVIFTCLVFFKRHPVQSRCTLAVGSVFTIFLSVLTGFGIMFIIGVPFTNFTLMLPFITMGIGLDDTFIITGEYFRTDAKQPTLDRIEKTMNNVGTSIFVTTITTSLAFALGLISTIPGVFWLCCYACPIIVLVFLYQITFFVSILVLDERRIQSNRKDFIFCCLKHDSRWGENETESHDSDGSAKLDENSSRCTYEIVYIYPDEKGRSEVPQYNYVHEEIKNEKMVSAPTPKRIVDRIMEWYSANLLRPWVKVFVILVFAGWFVLCTIRTTRLTQTFDPTDLLPRESYARRFFNLQTEYNERSFPVQAFFRDVNQSDLKVQQQMQDYIDDLVDSLQEFPEPPEFCWFRDFPKYWDDPLIKPFVKDKSFNDKVDFLLKIPPIKEVYGKDIVRDANTGNILASSCMLLVYGVGLNDADEQIELLRNQRAVSARQPINTHTNEDQRWAFFVFSEFFLVFEFLSIHFYELITTALTGIIAVSVVTFLFMPHWTAIIFVFPMMIMLYVDLVGTIQISGRDMNVVIFVGLVIAIGLLVDFIMHMLLRYYESSKFDRESKVKDALQNIGAPILLGGFSTFLGVVPMAFSTSTVLQDIYIVFLAIVLLGLTHGLILLPVVLSLIGPETCTRSHSSSDNDLPVKVNKIIQKKILREREQQEVNWSNHASNDGETATNSTAPSSISIKKDVQCSVVELILNETSSFF